MLKLLNIVDLNYDLQLIVDSISMPKNQRKEYKLVRKNEYLSKMNIDLDLPVNSVQIENFKSRFSLWCILDVGPFKTFLFKIKKAVDPYCRYCNLELETFHHFLSNCHKFKNFLLSNINFESITTHIVKTLFKDEYLIC